MKKKDRKIPAVTIIGAGRLGTALAIALSKKDYRVVALVSRNVRGAKKAAKLIASNPLSLSSENLSDLPSSDVIFITTPDGAIETVAKQLAENLSKPKKISCVFHTSGALSSEILKPLKLDDRIALGSFHPLVSVSDSITGSESLDKAFYCIEGDKKAVTLAKKIVKTLGGQSFSIRTKDKVLYHASAVVACGHFVALFDIAIEMLSRCGLSPNNARKALLPLVQSTVENLFISEPAKALTGTFSRVDFATAKKHLEAIKSTKIEKALKAYVLLGLRSIELARQNGKDEKTLNSMKELLLKSDEY